VVDWRPPSCSVLRRLRPATRQTRLKGPCHEIFFNSGIFHPKTPLGPVTVESLFKYGLGFAKIFYKVQWTAESIQEAVVVF
jgi:hypothetical protein